MVDEHVTPQEKSQFDAEQLRTIAAAKTARYKGQEELDYLSDLYAKNAIFVTRDAEFVDRVVDGGLERHAGIIFVPDKGTADQREEFCGLAATFIRVRTQGSRFAMRGIILYPDHDGVHAFEDGTDRLVVSWERIELG